MYSKKGVGRSQDKENDPSYDAEARKLKAQVSKCENLGRSLKESNNDSSSSSRMLPFKGDGEGVQSRYLKGQQNLAADSCHSNERHEEESIQVFVRVRPLNSMEKAKHSYSILDCPGTREVVVKERSNSHVTKTFTFDRAFGPQSKQLDVYKQVVAPLLEKVIQGYNCTVFAYGQTGTGKTFTMEGERSETSINWSEDPMAGIVPRALGQLFDELRRQSAEFTIRVSFLELYNEELYDLLAPVEGQKLKNLRMFEDPNKKNSVTISGLEEVIVQSKHEVYQIMEKGSERRKTAATLMNASSSRSHTVLSVIVHIKESTMEGEDLLKIGKLNLVDLAGSENIGRSGAVDKRAREAGNINQSLLTLGRVITALVEHAPHVPYRESKLTRILKDSLGGTTKTSIIATVSPAHINVEETLSTLEYAHRAKNITNQPTVNQRLTKHLVMSHYTEEIERLRRDLAASREKNGVWVDKANFEEQEAKVLSLQQELQSSSTHIKNLHENIEKFQADMVTKDAELNDLKEDNDTLRAILNETKARLAEIEDNLRREEQAKEEQKYLVERHVLTEQNLQQEAKVLMSTADEVTSNIERLWTKLERKRHIEQTNLEAGKRLKKEIADQLSDISNNIDDFRKDHATFCAEQRLILEQFLEEQNKVALEFQQTSQQHHDSLEEVWKEAVNLVQNQNAALQKIRTENQEEVAQKCQQSLDILQTVIHKVARVDLTDVLNKVMATQTGIQQIAEGFKSQMSSQSSILSRYMEQNLKNLERIDEHINTLQTEQQRHNSGLSVALGNHRTTAIDFSSAIENKVKELLEGLQSIASQTQEYKSQVKKQLQTMATKLEKSDQQLNDHCSTVVRVLAEDKEEAQKLHLAYHKSTEAISAEVDSNTAAAVTVTEDISGKVKQASKDLNELACSEETIIADTRKILLRGQEDLDTRVAQFQTSFGKLENDGNMHAQHLSETFKNFNSNIQEKESNIISEMQEGLGQHCVQVYEWSEGQRSEVYQQAGKVREFWDSTYLIDQPTGATPHRQAYTYPKTLSATSPHERLIGRFRAARRDYNDEEDRENF